MEEQVATSSRTARGNRETQQEVIGLSTADQTRVSESSWLYFGWRCAALANEKLGTDDAETTGIWPLYNSADRNAELVANRLSPAVWEGI